ncbi:blast:Metallocarboxypeptidase A-like protein MCYG_01475 [Drosophila guanche]|uniref:Blast:Metallocarboxypeptidase A-like protein MCYG_01475 n=1 Tax=Drosophila guanche TaxID=7266 RepID=A0A3B0JNW2_DROGU|nr:blast:Metallocarboxypeptidase A-like protein MCYG_01475 [Drosophila guanche]
MQENSARPKENLEECEQEQETANKEVIIVDAATHGNEWITTMVALKVINELVMNSVPNVKLLNAFDWYILPMVNPDGYELKLWKKNRSTNGGQYGTRLNGPSPLSCPKLYRGLRTKRLSSTLRPARVGWVSQRVVQLQNTPVRRVLVQQRMMPLGLCWRVGVSLLCWRVCVPQQC